MSPPRPSRSVFPKTIARIRRASLAVSRAVFKKLGADAVSWVSRMILAGILLTLAFAFIPMTGRLKNAFEQSRNMDPEAALRLARSTVGAGVIIAVPFRNWGDKLQYIAVWRDRSFEEGRQCVNGTTLDQSSPCSEPIGTLALELLVGTDGVFERTQTELSAGTQAGGDLSNYVRGMDAATRLSHTQHYWGIVDRDLDGTKEVLSITDSTGTSPLLPVRVSVFEIKTKESRHLIALQSRSSVEFRFVNASDPSARQWLTEIYRDFVENGAAGPCTRNLRGLISCNTQRAKEVDPAHDPNEDIIGIAIRDWNESNGVDFTEGKIGITWRDGTVATNEPCGPEMSGIQITNVFKGPLLAVDNQSLRTTAIYIQDTGHHREIPSIVFGKRLVWLGLVNHRGLLAIDMKSMSVEVQPAVLASSLQPLTTEWKGLEEERVFFRDDFDREPKDLQVRLSVSKDGVLEAFGSPLIVGGQDEFVGAVECQFH